MAIQKTETILKLDPDTRRVLNNLTKALEKVAKSQSKLQWTNNSQNTVTLNPETIQKIQAAAQSTIQLSEPAERVQAEWVAGIMTEEQIQAAREKRPELFGTNAAYEEWCHETDRLKKDCHSCQSEL